MKGRGEERVTRTGVGTSSKLVNQFLSVDGVHSVLSSNLLLGSKLQLRASKGRLAD